MHYCVRYWRMCIGCVAMCGFWKIDFRAKRICTRKHAPSYDLHTYIYVYVAGNVQEVRSQLHSRRRVPLGRCKRFEEPRLFRAHSVILCRLVATAAFQPKKTFWTWISCTDELGNQERPLRVATIKRVWIWKSLNLVRINRVEMR